MNKSILGILLAGIWMNISEFLRNMVFTKQIWADGFQQLGLTFPFAPINGAIWGLWAFIFVTVLAVLLSKFDAVKATLISWTLAFVLFWIVLWNMGLMPKGLLLWAVPWSLIEVYIAALIYQRVTR